METQEITQSKQKMNWQVMFKILIIAGIALVLLIPKFMILGLIHERQRTAESTTHEIMQTWSGEQTVRGPVLVIPYAEYVERVFTRNDNSAKNGTIKTISEKKVVKEINYFYVLPKSLNINGNIDPEKRKRSIYETVVYQSEINMNGQFEAIDLESYNISPNDILWDKAEILVSISDLRGINDKASLLWNDSTFSFLPGMENKLVGKNGISLPLSHLSANDFPAKFDFTLHLKGSESLNFAPLGETTEVTMKSKWNDPSFNGSFLPANHNITEDGFTANWKVLNYNRNFPQIWQGDSYNVSDSDFGVTLVTIADHYQKNSRAAKYAIMVILFVFLSFFLNEVIAKQKVHPFQYILVGFAILIFYLLLLSISEQLGFNLAYLIAATAVILMVLFYSKSFLGNWKNSIIQTFILTLSFGFIFVLMQLETYALLAGSIGLFVVLALTMFFTRKINWYND